MKKKLVVLLSLVLVMCTLLCACGVCRTCEGEKVIECPEKECISGDIKCDICDGTHQLNYEDCGNCKGGYNYEECPKCNGLGQITNPITWEKFTCPVCDRDLIIKVDCEECKGEGGFFDECENCNFAGNVADCENCDGKGKIDCPDCEEE